MFRLPCREFCDPFEGARVKPGLYRTRHAAASPLRRRANYDAPDRVELPAQGITVYDEPRPVLFDADDRPVVRAIGFRPRWILTKG